MRHDTPGAKSAAKVAWLVFMLGFSEVVMVTSSSQAANQLKHSILEDVSELQDSIYGFWACHGLDDADFGAFHGTLLRDGSPASPDAKGLVQMTRHAWAFSKFYQQGYKSASARAAALCGGSRPTASLAGLEHAAAVAVKPLPVSAAAPAADTPDHGKQLAQSITWFRSTAPAAGGAGAAPMHKHRALPNSREMANAAFEFVAEHMKDADDMFVWEVGRDGTTITAANKVIYGQWFVLYSFSQYASTFYSAKAKRTALACFRAIDAAWHDSSTGGYTELNSNTFPPDPAAPPLEPPLPDPLPRTLNVMMHGTEALTALHRATGDPTVLLRITEYVDIICTKLTRKQGLIFEAYVQGATAQDLWLPAPDTFVNYGHNLESTWLVADTLEYLLSLGAIAEDTAAQYLATVMSIGAAAVEAGYDDVHGGVFESGSPAGGVQSTSKVWWVQAESMLALWKLYEYYDDVRYLQRLQQTTAFVLQYVTDNEFGEQHWQVTADGTYDVTSDPAAGQKGNRWKASYHSSRAALFLEKWMSADTA